MALETDQEMPLSQHIEEMVQRLLYVMVVVAIGTILTFVFSEDIIIAIWNNFLPGTEIRVYSPWGKILTQIKFSMMVGIALAIPVLVYEAFVFMKPGLYPHERRYFLAVVPVSVVLVTLGLAFSYFVALEFLFQYFLTYSKPVAVSGLGLRETFNLIILLSLGLGIVFQIPLLMFMAIKMRVASREWFASKRIIIWAVFLSVAFLFAPDPTGMAAIIVAATMVFLFELTLLLLRFTSRDKTKSKRQEIEETDSESVGAEGVADTTNGGYEALDYDEYTPDSLTDYQEEIEKQVEEFEMDTGEGRIPETLTDIDEVGERRAEALREAGFETVEDIRRATQDELTEAKGIGEVLAAKIKKEVGGLNNEEVDDQESESESDDDTYEDKEDEPDEMEE